MTRLLLLVTLFGTISALTACKGGLDEASSQNITTGDSRILNDGSVFIKDTATASGRSRLLKDGSVFVSTVRL